MHHVGRLVEIETIVMSDGQKDTDCHCTFRNGVVSMLLVLQLVMAEQVMGDLSNYLQNDDGQTKAIRIHKQQLPCRRRRQQQQASDDNRNKGTASVSAPDTNPTNPAQDDDEHVVAADGFVDLIEPSERWTQARGDPSDAHPDWGFVLGGRRQRIG